MAATQHTPTARGAEAQNNELFEWVSLSPARTGVPVTLWISVRGIVATDPYDPENIMHSDAVGALTAFNHAALFQHWSGEIDGAELARRSRRLLPWLWLWKEQR